MNRPLNKMIRLASKPAPSSAAGRSARAKSIRKYTDEAITVQAASIRNNQSPRCGTCGAVVDPFNSDEGYSYCCNDRIEYADEWAAGPSPALWAAEYVFSKFAIEVGRVPGVMTADLGDYGVQFDVYVDRHNDELERIAARRW